MSRFYHQIILFSVVNLLLAITSSVAIVYFEHSQRLLINEINHQRAENEKLLLRNSQLLLESESLSSYDLVLPTARQTLSMHSPVAWEVLWLQKQ